MTRTPRSSNLPNSRDRIIASAGLVTIISSNASSRASSAMASATASTGSPPSSSARLAKPLVGFEHEGVEMDPAFGLRVDFSIADVHQHRLAAPDRAPQVNAAGTTGPGEISQQPAWPVEVMRKPVERLDAASLRRIGPKLAAAQQPRISRSDRSGHPRGFTRLSVPVKLCVGSPSCSQVPIRKTIPPGVCLTSRNSASSGMPALPRPTKWTEQSSVT